MTMLDPATMLYLVMCVVIVMIAVGVLLIRSILDGDDMYGDGE